MNRRWLLGMSALLALAVCLPAHAIGLGYVPKVGEVHRYEVTAEGSMGMTIEALRETGRSHTTVEVKCEQTALSQTGKATLLQIKLLGGKGTTEREGHTEPFAVPTASAVIEVDRRGRVTRLVEMNLEGKDANELVRQWTELLSGWSQFSPLPEGEVNVGDTWNDTFPLAVPPRTPAIEISVKSQLLDLTNVQGRQCAKIQTSFSGLIEREGSDMGPFGKAGPTTGNLRCDLTWYYDYANSIFVGGEGAGGIDMSRFLQGPLGPGMPNRTAMSTKMQMNVKIVLVQ